MVVLLLLGQVLWLGPLYKVAFVFSDKIQNIVPGFKGNNAYHFTIEYGVLPLSMMFAVVLFFIRLVDLGAAGRTPLENHLDQFLRYLATHCVFFELDLAKYLFLENCPSHLSF